MAPSEKFFYTYACFRSRKFCVLRGTENFASEDSIINTAREAKFTGTKQDAKIARPFGDTTIL